MLWRNHRVRWYGIVIKSLDSNTPLVLKTWVSGFTSPYPLTFFHLLSGEWQYYLIGLLLLNNTWETPRVILPSALLTLRGTGKQYNVNSFFDVGWWDDKKMGKQGGTGGKASYWKKLSEINQTEFILLKVWMHDPYLKP